MNLSTKQKQTHRHREQTCGCQERGVGGVWGGMEWEVGVSRCKLFIYRMDKQQGLTVEHKELYSISYDKPKWKRIFKNIYIYESLCCTAEINTTL